MMFDHWPARRSEMGRDVVSELERGDRLTGVQAGRAQLLRLAYQGRMLEQLASDGIDLIVTPTQPCSPPLIGTRRLPFAGDPADDVTGVMCGLTDVFNVLGWPAISVPCGSDSLGLPVGCQIAAAPWREVDCLSAAEVVELAAL